MNLSEDSLISRLSPKRCASRVCSRLSSLSFFLLLSALRAPLFLNGSVRSTNLPPVARNVNQFPINKVTRNVASLATQPRIFTKIDITLPRVLSSRVVRFGVVPSRFLTIDAVRRTSFPREIPRSVSPLSFFLSPFDTRTRGTGGEKRRWKKK